MAFWVMLAWVVAVWYFLQGQMSVRKLDSGGEYYDYVNVLYCIIIFSVPMVIISCRSFFGDSYSYLREFDGIDVSAGQFAEHISKRDHSQLFYGLEYYFKKNISQDSQFFIFFVALVQAILVIGTLRKYSCDIGFSLFIFVASAMVAQWMCNGIRQFLAVAILFACTDWIVKNKWYFYIPVAVLLMGLTPITSRFGLPMAPWFLCGVHQSALLAIPIFFCIQGKPFNIRVWAVVALLLALIATGGLDSMLSSSVENTAYSDDLEFVEADNGTNVIRVLFSSVPAALAYFFRQKIMSDDTPEVIKISANASVITSVLYVASAFTSGIYVGRLPIFTEIYNLILLPWLLKYGVKGNKQVINLIVISLYLVYYFYQVSIVWKGQYISEILGIGV